MTIGKTIMKSFAVLAAASIFAAPAPTSAATENQPPCPCEIARAALHIDESLRPIQPTVTIYDCVDTDGDGGELLRTRWNIIDVAGKPEEFSALKDALRQYNEETECLAVETRKQMTGLATAFQDELRRKGSSPVYPLCRQTDVFIRRADALAFSFVKNTWSDEGYGHSGYRADAATFDAHTGKRLSVSDVFTDLGELAGAIDMQLRRDYPDAPFMENGGRGLAEQAEALLRMTGYGKPGFTLDPCGASFYFNPGMLDGVKGVITATILFDERPELFKDEYRRAPKSYCMELCPWLPVRTVFADYDESLRDSLHITGSNSLRSKEPVIASGTAVQVQQVVASNEKLTVFCGGQRYVEPGFARDVKATLVSLDDGRRYIYADILSDDREYTTYIYDLNGETITRVPTGRTMTRHAAARAAEPETGRPGTNTFYILSDPEDFLMNDLDTPKELRPLRRCRVGADGRPEVIWMQGMG